MTEQNDAPADNAVTSQTEVTETKQRAFTLKSIGFGLISLLAIILFLDYNDFVLKQTSLVANHLPPGPIFLILSLALIWNPMWIHRSILAVVGIALSSLLIAYNIVVLNGSFFSWTLALPALFITAGITPVWNAIRQKMILSGKELIVALCIVLCGCWTAGAGLNNFYPHVQIEPWNIYNNTLQMQKYEAIEYVPEHLWPGGGLNNIEDPNEKKRIYDAFKSGYKEQKTDGIPWDAWLPQLLSSWLPMLALFSACLIALSLIVHRQWARHEQLAYPLAQIGTSLFEKEYGRTLPNIFYSNKFWMGAGLVLVFHMINYLHTWWPNNYPAVPRSASFGFFWELFPTLNKSGAYGITSFNFYFTIIGICFFLPREIGLSLGLSQLLLAFIGAQFYLSTGSSLGHEQVSNMRAGAYLAYAAVILYTGRHYYWAVLKKALFFKSKDDDGNDLGSEGVYAARVLMLSFVALIVILKVMFELEVGVAIIFSLLSMLLFLVFSRVICETGVPYMQAGWQPVTVITKVLGPSAIGAAPLVMMYYIGSLLFSDPKEAMMPYVSNSFKMADDYKIKLKKLCTMILIVVAGAIFVSVCARVYQHYTIGSHVSQNAYGNLHVPRNFLRGSTHDLSALEDIGQRTPPGEESTLSILDRIGLISPDSELVTYMFVGGLGVIVFFMLRFRYNGFPLHPVLFLVWGTYPSKKTFYCFLIGWIIRELIVRFGGGNVYQQSKPFFIGLIFAELFMGMFGAGVGWLYHIFHDFDELPPGFKVIPG